MFLSAIALIVALLAVGYVATPPSSPNQPSWIDNMWGCMGDWMSGNYATVDPAWAAYGVLLIIGFGVALIGIAGTVYFMMVPEIKTVPQGGETRENRSMSSYGFMQRTLTEDEQKVLNVLKSHGSTYLQKYIRQEAGLSRLETHRILARFAERSIVTFRKKGNTNEVTLAEWLK